MRRAGRGDDRGRGLAVALAGLALAAAGALACAASGPTYEAVEATLPPLAPGAGRIVVYRPASDGFEGFRPPVSVDDVPVGPVPPGTFVVVERPAGLHEVGIGTLARDSAFGNQGASTPVQVDVPAGATAFVQYQTVDEALSVVVELQPEAPTTALPLVERLHLYTADDTED